MTEMGLFSTNLSNTSPSMAGLLSWWNCRRPIVPNLALPLNRWPLDQIRHRPSPRWVRTRRSTLRPVSSSSPFRTVRAALTAHGAAPLVTLHGTPMKHRFLFRWHSQDVASVLDPISPTGPREHLRHSLRVRWILCSPSSFVLRTPKGEGPSPSVLILVDPAFLGSDCRVGRGWAKWPSLRPLAQTARAVFPQAAFLCCAFMASSLDKTRNKMDQAY